MHLMNFGNLNRPKRLKDDVITYLCSLISELAYRHVPQFEIDASSKRAKLVVPSDGYYQIVRAGVGTSVMGYLAERPGFVVVDRGVIAVGLVAGQRLFIGYRGPALLFD